jgi:endonuclease/exonuclease/phosphatase (EEP) superfamily protein YafD
VTASGIHTMTVSIAHTLAVVAVIGAATCLALQLAGDRLGAVIAPAQALTPWVVPFALPATVVAIVLGRYLTATVGGVTVMGFVALVVPVVFPAELPPAATGAPEVTIVHSNLLYSNPTIDDAITALLATGADVIAVSELTPEFQRTIERSPIGAEYPFASTKPTRGAGGLGIWSRQPLVAGPRPPDSRMTLSAEVDLGGRPLVILLAHPPPPLRHVDEWRTEMAAIAARPVAERQRTVLVADLNVSYFHPAFRRFLDRTGWLDVHTARGKGFSASWPTDRRVPPFVRLDHALVGADVTATKIEDVDVPGSDHRGFVVGVSWADR